MAPQMPEFIQRQLTALAGLTDALSVEIRQSWEWLAAELASPSVLAAEPASPPVLAVEPVRVVGVAPGEPQAVSTAVRPTA